MDMISSPLFIVFDGMDGTGKTTQMHRLAERLRARGVQVVTTVEPTGLPTGRRLRDALGGRVKVSNAEIAAMFVHDRICHNTDPEDGIEKHLADGAVVLCDRYYYSSLTYQGGDDPGTFAWVASMNLDCPSIRHPDGVIFFDMDPAASMARITAGRDPSQLEIYETVEQQKRLRERYRRVREYLRARTGGACESMQVVDASGTPDEVADLVKEAFDRIVRHVNRTQKT